VNDTPSHLHKNPAQHFVHRGHLKNSSRKHRQRTVFIIINSIAGISPGLCHKTSLRSSWAVSTPESITATQLFCFYSFFAFNKIVSLINADSVIAAGLFIHQVPAFGYFIFLTKETWKEGQ
jgi:hypothetical protein